VVVVFENVLGIHLRRFFYAHIKPNEILILLTEVSTNISKTTSFSDDFASLLLEICLINKKYKIYEVFSFHIVFGLSINRL
jgi:hypothetical protein